MELPLTSVTIFTVTVWYERIFSDTCISRQQTVHISRQINAVVASSIICGTRQSDSGSRQSKRWLKIYGGAFWRHTFRSCWVSYYDIWPAGKRGQYAVRGVDMTKLVCSSLISFICSVAYTSSFDVFRCYSNGNVDSYSDSRQRCPFVTETGRVEFIANLLSARSPVV